MAATRAGSFTYLTQLQKLLAVHLAHCWQLPYELAQDAKIPGSAFSLRAEQRAATVSGPVEPAANAEDLSFIVRTDDVSVLFVPDRAGLVGRLRCAPSAKALVQVHRVAAAVRMLFLP
eukprot:scaffold3159_cov393-Prasinococcus_capsulatus_cf.AAC.27